MDKTVDENSIGLSTQSAANETLRIYAKTLHTLRVEFAFKKKRIQAVLRSNQIKDQSFKGVQDLVDRLLAKARETLRRLELTLKNIDSGESEISRDVISFVRLCGPYETFHLIASILVATGRVKYTHQLAYTLRKLMKSGLLTKGERGIYICRPQVIVALAQIIQM